CQNERSQFQNKDKAMEILRGKLLQRKQMEDEAKLKGIQGDLKAIGWGSQIRSYVLQPYQMVKDLRTNVETSNVQAVMDGDIDRFIEAWLRAGKPRTRIQN
ncbi:MAG TPA: peptide chain release factor 2, partial [Opitutae bacterium]|nr:peptide chain release factor 2 [Opitutae bacterium]